MLSFFKIWTVAKFEMRTLLRGWFFRIFSGLIILGISIFNIAVFVDASGAPWIYRALPASIPYANLIILNLGQAIVAVFLASEFFKQDKKNDTVEVIYARSMSNAEYIFGKTFGILLVFFILNIIVLFLGIGLSFLSSDYSGNILSYLIYPFLISLPTLIYILGLSFFLMIMTKNQAVTFILLLGYIALTIFYLNFKFYHLADFIAYNVPMMHSTIGGFGNFQEVIMHRSIYFFVGLGLISFSIHKINRLPQAGKFQSLPIILMIVFLAIGGLITFKYIDLKKQTIAFKNEMIAINDSLDDMPVVYIESCKLILEHKGDEIDVKADLVICNKSDSPIDTLIFSLNPSLEVKSVEMNGKKANYIRNIHILMLINNDKIQPGENKTLTLSYSGKINENTHFLDLDPNEFEDNFSVELFRIRKRYAYLQDKFVCLTSESLWYPISGVGHSTKRAGINLPDFTKYELTVKTNPKLTAISQGEMKKISEGIFEFRPEYALPKISLIIADYKKYSVTVDQIEFNIYTKSGNDYFSDYFSDIKDSIPLLISDLKNEYEAFIESDYPFKRFNLAEVPIHFALDKHIWSVSSDAVQPEIIMYCEKGVIMEETDFRKRILREEENMKNDNEEILPEELQARIFKRFIRGNFMATPKERYMFNEIVDRNTYTLFPNFYSFVTQVKSKEFPIINLAIESYLRERNVSNDANRFWNYEGIIKDEKVNLELQESPLKLLIEKGIEKFEDEENPININDVIIAKGSYLFLLFRTKYGEKRFDALLNGLINAHKHQSFDFELLDSAMYRVFKETISKDVNIWYNTKELAGFLIKDIKTYKVQVDEYSKYQIRFKVSNPEKVDGLITVSIEMSEEENANNRDWDDLTNVGFSKIIHMPAKTAKEIGFVFPAEPARMNIYTHISENIPINLNYDFTGFEELKKVKPLDSIIDYPLFSRTSKRNETIVDNEDNGFEYKQITNQSYLKSIIKDSKKQKYKYSGIRFWNPPGEWESVLRSGFYGKYIRSAMYTKAGDGDLIAVWNAKLKEAGNYDVYSNIERIEYRWGRTENLNYNFKVYHDDGIEEISLSDQEIETGWNYLGTFYISSAYTKVELTNKSSGNMVFADAIKWVKSK